MERVLAVDNGSTDDTAAVLAGFAAEGVEVRSLPRNLGAAGGYRQSMRLGYETGADFVWVMDDVIAGPEALKGLMRACDPLESERADAPSVVSCAAVARDVNQDASVALARAPAAAGAGHVVFASSCSVDGMAAGGLAARRTRSTRSPPMPGPRSVRRRRWPPSTVP